MCCHCRVSTLAFGEESKHTVLRPEGSRWCELCGEGGQWGTCPRHCPIPHCSMHCCTHLRLPPHASLLPALTSHTFCVPALPMPTSACTHSLTPPHCPARRRVHMTPSPSSPRCRRRVRADRVGAQRGGVAAEAGAALVDALVQVVAALDDIQPGMHTRSYRFGPRSPRMHGPGV